jgi:hypothetical protein
VIHGCDAAFVLEFVHSWYIDFCSTVRLVVAVPNTIAGWCPSIAKPSWQHRSLKSATDWGIEGISNADSRAIIVV